MGANRVVATNVSLQISLKWHPCHLPLKQAIFAETLKAETAEAEPPKIKIGVAEASSFDLPSHLCSPIISDI
jgi:hypothetical protein